MVNRVDSHNDDTSEFRPLCAVRVEEDHDHDHDLGDYRRHGQPAAQATSWFTPEHKNNARLFPFLMLLAAMTAVMTFSATTTTPRSSSITTTNDGFRPAGQLRLDWEHLQPQSKIARELTAQRYDCNNNHTKLMWFDIGGGGLGAALGAYTYAMCFAHNPDLHGDGRQVRLYTPHFMFRDKAVSSVNSDVSDLTAYFTTLELNCPGDREEAARQQASARPEDTQLDIFKLRKHRKKINVCESILGRPGYKGVYSNLDMRASAVEAIFTAGLSPAIVSEARRQHALVFGERGAPPSAQLITVHVRWGDKKTEMQLVDMDEYISAVYGIAAAQGLEPAATHVYLATEDPAAVQAFTEAADPAWHLYIDQFYKDMLPFRNNVTQEVASVARDGNGHVGLLALGSLLVAMEANHFVLTSASNWSRRMNELRRTVVRSTCPGGYVEPSSLDQPADCTSAVDLRVADFWMERDADGNGV